MDTITLGTDPWSERVLSAIKESPHQATLNAWAEGKNPLEYDTPYVEYLTIQKRTPREKAERLQDAFHELSKTREWRDTEPRNESGTWRGPITFRVRADGDIGCDDGFHRLNILHHRGEPLVGWVAERAPEWVALRESVRVKLDTKGWKGKLYHPIPHPDFGGWPVHHPSPPPLVGMVVKYGLRRVLDLGTHFGYALYSLRNHVGEGIGVERDPVACSVAKLVLSRSRMTAVREDLAKYLRRAPEVDLVLALNVLHHVPLDEVLALIRAKFVAVSLPNPSEAGSQKLPPDPYEYVRRKLRASVVWEAPFEGRALQLLRVTP